jgi:hypothetical protein
MSFTSKCYVVKELKDAQMGLTTLLGSNGASLDKCLVLGEQSNHVNMAQVFNQRHDNFFKIIDSYVCARLSKFISINQCCEQTRFRIPTMSSSFAMVCVWVLNSHSPFSTWEVLELLSLLNFVEIQIFWILNFELGFVGFVKLMNFIVSDT